MVSPADDDTVEAMRQFGYQTGMAFQIVDDILDFTGEQAAVGKPVGSDLLQGLVTLPAIYYTEIHPDDPDVRLLEEGGWGHRERMERLVESIRTSDAIQQAMGEAEQAVARALALLTPFQAGVEREALAGLARYIVDRQV
jgi:geranylgeranyl pyrophosphate synthase